MLVCCAAGAGREGSELQDAGSGVLVFDEQCPLHCKL